MRAATRITERADPEQKQSGLQNANDRAMASCGNCWPLEWPIPRRPLAGVDAKYHNRIEFKNYRKFTTDSKLQFEQR